MRASRTVPKSNSGRISRLRPDNERLRYEGLVAWVCVCGSAYKMGLPWLGINNLVAQPTVRTAYWLSAIPN